MSTTWSVVDSVNGEFVFNFRQNDSHISYKFIKGGTSSLQHIQDDKFYIHDVKLRGVIAIYIDSTDNTLVFQFTTGQSYIKINQSTVDSLKAYFRSIAVDTTVPGFVATNTLTVASYSSADDVLHTSDDEDPVPHSRNEDEPYNISVGDPIRGGARRQRRRSTRKPRRNRHHVKNKSRK